MPFIRPSRIVKHYYICTLSCSLSLSLLLHINSKYLSSLTIEHISLPFGDPVMIGELWMAADHLVAALVVPTVEVISGQADLSIPCTAATKEPAAVVRSYSWTFNGTFVHFVGAKVETVGRGAKVETDGSLQFSEIRPEHTGMHYAHIFLFLKNN